MMKLHRAHLAAAYLTAALLVLFPILDATLAVWPLRPGSVAWRYGSVGIFSRAMLTPLLGLVVASGVALLAKQRGVQRTLGAISGGLAFFLLFTTGRFLLDAAHMRGQVGDDLVAQSTLDATTVPAAIKLLLILAATLLTAAGNWFARPAHPAANANAARAVDPRRVSSALGHSDAG